MMTDAKTITVLLNVSGDGDRDGDPQVAAATFTEDELLKLGRDIERVAALKAEGDDVYALLFHAWGGVRWLRDDDHGSLEDALQGPMDSLGLTVLSDAQDDSESRVVLTTAQQQALFDLLEREDLEVRSELDERKVREDDVVWTAYPKHGGGDRWVTAALSKDDIADLLRQLRA